MISYFLEIQQGIDTLVQSAADKRRRTENSDAEVIAKLSVSMNGALAYSKQVLEKVIDYRDNVVLKKYDQSTAFRIAELDVLNTHIEFLTHGVMILDRLNKYVSEKG